MYENNGTQNNRSFNRNLSAEEKRSYCVAWKKSRMSQHDFCKANGISKSALYNWIKAFKKENKDKDVEFSPIVLKDKPPEEQSGMIQLNIDCPNHIRLSISIPEYRLLTFIKEIGYATSTVW